MFDESIIRRLKAWKQSPLLFGQECMHFNPSDQQAEALHVFPKTRRLSIRSGHGTGKDALVGGVLIPWFLVTRTFPKVVCVAPTARQLSDILWSEISKWMRQSLVADEFTIQRDKIFQNDNPREWWCRAISPSAKASPEEQVESVAGIHGEHLLWVIDEASGCVDPIFIPIEGSCTQEDNNIILIGNMTRNQGYFYDSHFHTELKKVWTNLHWDSRKSTNVKQSYCEYMETKYGVDSNIFRIRVAGEPPSGDDNTLIPLAWAEQCVGNEISVAEDEPLYDGVDVARFGDDDSVILPRVGNLVNPWETYNGMQTIDLAMRVRFHLIENEAMGCAVDEIGVGAGVVDWLAKHNTQNLFGVNVSSASSDISKSDRLRDQLWLTVRDKCMRQQYSFPTTKAYGDVLSQGQMLANELASLRYSFNSHGGYKVESKKDAKKRGIPSPNIADALCLTEYFNAYASQVFRPQKRRTSQDRWKNIPGNNVPTQHSWQTA
jgi:hypothetical protein